MTMQELSKEYKIHANVLSIRIAKLETMQNIASLHEKEKIQERIQMLTIMRDEAIELSRVTEEM